MAKYCPQCYGGVSADDHICGNCGAVLQEEKMGNDNQLPVETILVTEVNEEVNEEAKDREFDSYNMEETPSQETFVKGKEIENETPILSLGDWMLTLLLLMIPIVNIVMLIVWSADSKTNPNKRHFAWAQLIYMGIIFVLGIIFSSIFTAIMISVFNSMNS